MSKIRRGIVISSLRRASVSPGLFVWYGSEACARSSFLFAWGGDTSPRVACPVRPSALPKRVTLESTLSEVSPTSNRRSLVPGRSKRADELLRSLKRSAFQQSHEELTDDMDDTLLGVSSTALYDRTRKMSDPSRFVDSHCHPFITLSTRTTFHASGVRLGDFATVTNLRTGRHAHAIVGDSREVPGAETSSFLTDSLGLKLADTMAYLVHPQSGVGQGSIPSNIEIQACGEALLRRPAGSKAESWAEILEHLGTEFPQTLASLES